MRLSLKGRAEVCAVILYRLSVLPLPKVHRLALIQTLSKLLWSDRKPMVRRQIRCWRPWDGVYGCLIWRATGSLKKLAYLGRSLSRDMVWGQKVRDFFPRLDSDLEAEGRRKPRGAAPFKLPRSSDISRSRKELYRELLVGSASDPLAERLGWSLEEIRSQWNWVQGSGFLNNFKFSLTRRRIAPCRLGIQSRFCRHAGLPLLRQWPRRNGWARLLLLRAGSSVLSHVREWTARIDHKQFVPLDVGYVVDNVDPPYRGEKRVVFLVIQALARWMVIWTMRKKGLYDGANVFHRDLILFFRHQLRVKIRCDWKRLDCITFDKRWVYAASLVVRKWATLESSFPFLSAHGDDGPGPSGPHPR